MSSISMTSASAISTLALGEGGPSSLSTPGEEHGLSRIGVTTFGTDRGLSGIGFYLKNLLDAFSGIPGFPETHLLGCPPDLEAFPVSFATPRLVSRAWDSPMRNVFWHQVGLSRLCRQDRHDVLFLPAANRRVPAHVPCPTVGTVHDFSSLHVPGKYDPARDFYIRKVLPTLIRKLSLVVTPSESSKKDIVEYAGVDENQVTVVPNGVDHQRFRSLDPEKDRYDLNRCLGIDGPFIVYVARLEHPGKNHLRLIRAFEILKNRLDLPHRLVLAGKDWTRAGEIHRAAAESPVSPEIILTGHVAGALLPSLYGQADLMVFPSLFEGFGLPVLEAMASGTPVACASISSLPEVGGDAAAYFNPFDTGAMAGAMAQILEDPEFKKDLQERGLRQSRRFTWEACARKTLGVMSRAKKEAA